MADHSDKAFPMPDLTALLCAFQPGFKGSKLDHGSLRDKGGQLILTYSDTGVPVYDIKEESTLEEAEIQGLLEDLVVGPLAT
jgi:hypothetical protein